MQIPVPVVLQLAEEVADESGLAYLRPSNDRSPREQAAAIDHSTIPPQTPKTIPDSTSARSRSMTGCDGVICIIVL
ncbi:MAG: hypothetical protein DWQ37_20315 [Planctomycetota bacterium]|nr:MAG: hypothetical protein DWQ37_20315 [Planctomycetota bacterium]